MEITIQEIAKEAEFYFKQKTRNNGDKFYVLGDGRPEWLRDLVYDAHNDTLPDDFIYKFIWESIVSIMEDGEDAYVEGDIYTSDLTSWLNSNNGRVSYLTMALEELEEEKNGFNLLGYAQKLEKDEVFHSVLKSLEDQAELENEEMEV